MKQLSPLRIRERINSLGYLKLKRKNTELEKLRIFWMEQNIINAEIRSYAELKSQGVRVIVADRC